MDYFKKLKNLHEKREEMKSCMDRMRELEERGNAIRDAFREDPEYKAITDEYLELQQKHGDMVVDFSKHTDDLITGVGNVEG